MNINTGLLEKFYENLPEITRERLDLCVEIMVKTKQNGGKIAVVTGSGPNIHEGVTTFIAELISKGIIDGVLTSSAVIAHEMAGALDRVKRVNAANYEFPGGRHVSLPRGDVFELTLLNAEQWREIRSEMEIDEELVNWLENAEGKTIIKAAGNMAYPMGLRTERLATELLEINRLYLNSAYPLEFLAGLGADPKTMIGAGALNNVPVMVTVPQLIGGGAVGLAIGDSIGITKRCIKNAEILAEADVIIESAIALAQEIHDGPFETYTGHGIWAEWDGSFVYSLKNKHLIRIDLDTNLEKVWQKERSDSEIQRAIADGKPKTKITGVPFRMEMSGFARLEGSIPLIGDIGEIWPVLGYRVARDLGIKLDFVCYKQETEEGKKMREWIVENVSYIKREKLREALENLGVVDMPTTSS